jgi:hypothetical protein
MADYTIAVVRAVLQNWQELEALKYKITPTLIPNSYVSEEAAQAWYMTEGNTMTPRGPRTTRIPHNSHAIVERLCDLTADIQRGRRLSLTQEEDVALLVTFTLDLDKVPSGTASKGEAALEKLVNWLNQC